jgi:hypothetical protein
MKGHPEGWPVICWVPLGSPPGAPSLAPLAPESEYSEFASSSKSYRIGRCIVWAAIQRKNRNRRSADGMGTSEAYRSYWGVRKKSPRYGSWVGQRPNGLSARYRL